MSEERINHPVLLVHGWLAGATSWSRLVPYLDQRRRTWARVDLRGYGARRHLAGEHSIREAAADVLAAADELGWSRFSLVGHSMGALVAQAVLAVAGERVRSLAGVSGVPANGSPLPPDRRAIFEGAIGERVRRRAFLDASTGSRQRGAFLDRMVDESMADVDPAVLGDYLDAWTGTDLHARIEGRTLPVLAVVGELDPAYPEARVAGTWVRWYPNCEVVRMAGCGHYPMDEAPADLAALLEKHLDAVGA